MKLLSFPNQDSDSEHFDRELVDDGRHLGVKSMADG